MAIGTHQADKWLVALDASLPDQITDRSWDAALPKSAFLGTIRTAGLVKFICTGPNYRRAVDDALTRAIRAFRQADGVSFLMWLGDALKAAR